MKKILYTLIALLALTVEANAQGIEIYKNGVLVKSYTNTTLEKFNFVFTKDPQTVNKNLLGGRYSVSANKEVQFTTGNLYWNGTAFALEAEQTASSSSNYGTYDSNHVSHFFWTSAQDYQSGNADYMPYAAKYKCSTTSADDKMWCDEENKLTVNGVDGLYVLTGAEWDYLLNGRENASNLCKVDVTVNGNSHCLVIAPDNYTGTLQSSYDATSWAEAEAYGLVCLPPAGNRSGDTMLNGGNYGNYWKATPESDASAYVLSYSNQWGTTVANGRSMGYSIRLVKNITFIEVTGVTLSETEMDVMLGTSETLTATIAPVTADNQNLVWSSSDESVATVTNGVVTAVSTGSATITCTTTDGSKLSASCLVTVPYTGTAKATLRLSSTDTGTETDVEWVQLWENGPKWAVMNVGANKVTERGGHYAWGASNDFNYSNRDVYCTGTTDIQGTEYDTAKNIWGDNWMMPTADDYKNLLANCDTLTCKNYQESGLKGLVYTGRGKFAGNSIFLPCTGQADCYNGYYMLWDTNSYASYWASTPDDDDEDSLYANKLHTDFGDKPVDLEVASAIRYTGFGVRAILK